MSSLRVRAQNQILKQLGAAKPSKNVQFDAAYANFESSHAGVVNLEGALRGFIVSLKAFHMSAQVLYGAFETVGGAPDNSPAMRQVIAELKNTFLHVDVNALNDSVKQFENRVLRPTTGWLGQAQSVKQQVHDFNEEKTKYDHYTRKVMSLREARDKRSAGGKSEKSKDVEKLIRNEQKLAASTNSYAKISEVTIKNLREFVDTREATLTPIIQRTLDFRVKYANRIADESKLMQRVVHHDSALDSVLRNLESFAAKITGHGPDPTVENDTAYTAPPAEPEPPVQSLSFQSFVGEEPPVPAAPAVAEVSKHDSWNAKDMPQLPKPRTSFSAPPAPPTSPANGTFPPPASLPVDAFFGDFGSSFATSPPMSPTFDSAPVQPLHSPPISPSAPSFASSNPWDDFVPPPPPLPIKTPAQFMTVPTSPPTSTPASPTNASGWDSFNTLSGSDFQKMHQNAMH